MKHYTVKGFVEGVGRLTEMIILGIVAVLAGVLAAVATSRDENDDEEVASH